MYKLVHVLDFCLEKFIRTLLSPNNTSNSIEYHLIIPTKFNLESFYKYFNKNNYIIHRVSSYKHMYKVINIIKPNAVLTTVHPSTNIINELLNNIDCKTIFYFQHGFFCPNNTTYNLTSWSDKLSYIISDIYELKVLTQFNKLKKKPIRTFGLPQIDLLLNNISLIRENKVNIAKKIPFHTKKIFLVIGGASFNYTHTQKSLESIINSIRSVYHDDWFILFKPRNITEPICWLIKTNHQQNIHILSPTDFIYDFMFSDVIIVEEGGSMFLESLLVNPNTILYQNENPNNFYEYPIQSDHSLMITKTDQDLKNCLNIIKLNNLPQNYNEHIEKLFMNMVGTHNVTNISDDVIEKIINYHH